MKKLKKILTIIGDVALVIFILLAAIITIISLNTKDRGVTNISGRVLLNIQTDSMKPTINPGDLIITKQYNGEEIKEGDIISFFAFEQDTTIIKTHRVIEVNNTNGTITFTTKGDNSVAQDQIELTKNDIVAIYESNDYNGTKVPFIGKIFSFLQSQVGFLLCIIFPLLIFFIYQLYKFIETIIDEKKKESLREIEEARKKAS